MIKTILSLILGLLLGSLIILLFLPRIMPHGPDSNDVRHQIYHHQTTGCYRMIPQPVICPL
jgi:hypothetical protein